MTPRVVVVGDGPDATAVGGALGRNGALVVDVTGDLNVAAAADLVIEATPDAPAEAKATALAALLGRLPADAPIAVLTRTHTLDTLLTARRHGSRVVGLHLLPGTRVAEVAMAAAYDDAVVDAILDLLEAAGLVALPCADAPGRIVDRLVASAALEARDLAVRGHASPTAIAEATGAAGLSLVAIAEADLPAIAAALHAGLDGPARFAALSATPSSEGTRPGGRTPLDVAAVAERLELAAIAEAYRLVGDAVAGAEEIERAMTVGAGWAAGPFTIAGRRGLRAVVSGLAALGQAPDGDAVTADRFAIPQLLWQMATV